MTTNGSSRYVLLSFQERQLLASAAHGVAQTLAAMPGSALWSSFAAAARTLDDQATDGALVTDEAVERAARAFYEYPTPGVDQSLMTNWARLKQASPDVAENYRAHMRAALEAALGGGSS